MPDFRDIAKWFEEFEMRLIQSLKRNLGRHESEEKAQDMEWSMWQAEKLKGINKFRRECTWQKWVCAAQIILRAKLTKAFPVAK